MKKIAKIWFEDGYIYGSTNDGVTRRQSLLWYSKLRNASDEERDKYEFGVSGIHWRELDEDVSFESFFYEDAEPSKLQAFFLSHPEINVAGFANRIGLNAALLRNYINGFKKPSADREEQILAEIRSLGKEMANWQAE